MPIIYAGTTQQLMLQEKCVEHNLQPTEWMLEKIQQIHGMLTVRHGVMIIGEPMSAKTRVGPSQL